MASFDVQRRTNVPIQQPAERLGETVKWIIAQGPYARCVQSIQAGAEPQVGGGIGEMRPIHLTAGVASRFPAISPAREGQAGSSRAACRAALGRMSAEYGGAALNWCAQKSPCVRDHGSSTRPGTLSDRTTEVVTLLFCQSMLAAVIRRC